MHMKSIRKNLQFYNFTINRDHSNKKEEKKSSTLADIQVDNLIPYSVSSLHILAYLLFGELTSATSKERMTMNIIFAGTTPID